MIGSQDRLNSFARRTDVSARSVLVTIFGDSIVPAGGQVWLSDIISLGEVFGFSERLVRTSIYRLTQDGWFATTKQGRRSRYELTSEAQLKFAQAERRIYHPEPPAWQGEWTLALIGGVELGDGKRQDFLASLRTRGFGELASGTWASPWDDETDWLESKGAIIAKARFSDQDKLKNSEQYANGFGLVSVGEQYERFCRSWAGLETGSIVDPATAFGLRTILIHEFRRLRHSHFDLPVDLLPDWWPGADAAELAGRLYETLSPAANAWLDEAHSLDSKNMGRFAAP